MPTQNERVLKLLRARGKHGLNTVDLQAPACDGHAPILRLAARVHDLQGLGYRIRSERKLNGTATYFLEGEPPVLEPRTALDGSLFDAGPFASRPLGFDEAA